MLWMSFIASCGQSTFSPGGWRRGLSEDCACFEAAFALPPEYSSRTFHCSQLSRAARLSLQKLFLPVFAGSDDLPLRRARPVTDRPWEKPRPHIPNGCDAAHKKHGPHAGKLCPYAASLRYYAQRGRALQRVWGSRSGRLPRAGEAAQTAAGPTSLCPPEALNPALARRSFYLPE